MHVFYQKYYFFINPFRMPVSAEKIIVLDATDSTNNYAMALIGKGAAKHGSAVFTLDQFEGKGRHEKTWHSEPGKNIILSIITQMQWASLFDQFYLSMAAALSCAELMKRYTKEKIFVKWPNDIFIGDSKAAGILIENVIQGNLWQWAVTGIGINVNQNNFPVELNATSLKKVTGKDFDVLQLCVELREIFLFRMLDWKQGKNNWIDEYNNLLYGRGKRIRLQRGNIVFETTLQSVSEKGKLITRDTLEREWNFDEVSIKKVCVD